MNLSFDRILFENFIASAKQCSIDEGYKLMRNFFAENLFPFPTVEIGKGKVLFRARIHEKGQDYFFDQQELSFIKDTSIIKTFGRCNAPGESMFYCSDNQLLSYVEVCQMKKGHIPETHYYTLSAWKIIEDVNIGFLLDEETNPTMAILCQEWNRFFDHLSFEHKEIVRQFQYALFKEFTIPSNKANIHYIVSAAYTYFLFHQWNNYDLKIEGFAYPTCIDSIELKGKGINFCFIPGVIGFNKKIELIDAWRVHFVLEQTVFNAKDANHLKFIDRNTGIITW